MAKIKAKAIKLDIELEIGATLERTFILKDASQTALDLTGYDARMQVRTEIDDATVIDELTVANTRLELNTPQGAVIFKFPEATSVAIYTEESYVYDLELIYPSGKVRRLFKGSIITDKEVTR